jgi:hypothetical protein
MPRTILGEISGNRGVGNELTPNARGQIQGSRKIGGSWGQIRDTLKIPKSTARNTVRLAAARVDGESRPRSGRPPKYDLRDERRILRYIRYIPKAIYASMKEALHIYLSTDTFTRILDKYGIKK